MRRQYIAKQLSDPLHKIEKMEENKNKKEHRKCAKNECESYSAVIQKLRVSEKHANRDSHLVNIN